MSTLFDPGLQPERTGLAWQRTCLAVLAGSLAALKVLPPVLGPWSLLLGLAGVIETLALLALVRHRYLRRNRILTSTDGPPGPVASGRLITALALTTLIAGLVSLAVVLRMGQPW